MAQTKNKYRRPVRSGKQSTTSEKAAEKIRGGAIGLISNKPARIIISGLILAMIVFAVVLNLHDEVSANPQKVFWDMIANNLKTAGVTKEVHQRNNQVSADELIQLSF